MISKILIWHIAGLTILSSAALAGGDTSFLAVNSARSEKKEMTSFYITGRAGYANNNWNQILEEINFLKHIGFSGGVTIGYSFNPFLAIEGSYNYLPKASWDTYQAEFANNFVSVDTYHVGQIKNHALDLAGKITVPILGIKNIGLFAKAGIAKLKSSIFSYEDRIANVHVPELSAFQEHEIEYIDQKNSNTTLTYGFGAYWDVMPNIRLDLSYQTWRGKHKNIRTTTALSQPNMDAYTLGLTYFIGAINS